jgi:type II secretory pathway pseudopilin PulG
VEFLVVLVLIAIIGAIVGPAFQNSLPSVRVSKTAAAFLATTRKAHMDAALTAKRQRLYLRKDATEISRPAFWLAFEPRPLEEPGIFKPVPGSWGEATEVPEFVLIVSSDGAKDGETGEVYLEFNTDGTASDATVTFASNQGEQVSVKTKGSTGESKIAVEEVPK